MQDSHNPRLHDYIYKTQYIAPLGSKLDPSRSNSSPISVLGLPDRLTVEWSNVSVMAEAEHPTGGSFTFPAVADIHHQLQHLETRLHQLRWSDWTVASQGILARK